MDRSIQFSAIAGSRWPGTGSGPQDDTDLSALRAQPWLEQPVWLGYVSPAECLTRWAADLGSQAPDPEAAARRLESWISGARLFLALKHQHGSRCRLVHLGRLQPSDWARLAREAGQPEATWHSGDAQPLAGASLDPRLEPLLWNHPDLADLYADLEGCADLYGRSPELTPMRMGRADRELASSLLLNWHGEQQRLERDKRERMELQTRVSRLQSEQRQLREAAAEAQRQVEAANQALQAIQGDVSELREQVRQRDTELVRLRERSDACLEQLEQTQLDLELTFQDRQAQHQLNQAQGAAIAEASAMLQRLAALRGLPGSSGQPATIQLLALLEGYRHSLKRAERLLSFSGRAY